MQYMNEFEDLLDRIINECSGNECKQIFTQMLERLKEVLEDGNDD